MGRGHAPGDGEILTTRGLSTLKADEGGYGPPLQDHRAALRLMDQAVIAAGLRPGEDIVYALDVAATHFFDPASDTYRLASENRTLDRHRAHDVPLRAGR